MIILEPPGCDDKEDFSREADVSADGRRRRASVRWFSFTVHLLKRHLGDAVLTVLVHHRADSPLLLHHFVVSVSKTCEPGLVPRQLAVTNQWVICRQK